MKGGVRMNWDRQWAHAPGKLLQNSTHYMYVPINWQIERV